MFFTTYLRLIFGLDVSFLRSLFVLYSSFVRSLFVFCSFIVRSLFVHCSFIVRLLFVFSLSARAARTVFCSSFVRLLFVIRSSFVRLFSICPCGSHYLPVRLALSARAARTICPCGSHCATTACATRTFNASFFTKLLPHTYQNTSQRFFSRQSQYFQALLLSHCLCLQ